MPTIVVIGGGITGQMVQWAVPQAVIYDWKSRPVGTPRLTRNLGGNYLWAPVGNLPCRTFPVITEIDGRPATPESILAYKTKIGKGEENQSAWGLQFAHETIGYDFDGSLPPARIQYDHRVIKIDWRNHVVHFSTGSVPYDALVSTIPLYSLLGQLGMMEPSGRLKYNPIYVRTGPRPPDAPYPPDTFYVNYISSPTVQPYRLTDREGERHYESLTPMGTVGSKRLTPGKIHDHREVPVLLQELEMQDIYAFGRYGAWRSDELVHETWRHICTWKEDYGL